MGIMAELRNVEIFAVGTWNNMKFVEADLQEIADNTNKFIERLRPSLKIGHSTNQILKGQSDGDPALGTLDNIRVEGSKLIADFVNVPDIVSKAINAGLYKQVSVEMRNIEHTGWTLTAVAILGADIPAVKTLEDLQAFLSEGGSISKDFSPELCFSEKHSVFTFDKEENMSEEKSSTELIELQAKLAKLEAENANFKEKEIKAKFNEEKSKALETFSQDVKDGKLPPAIFDKISNHFDSQEVKFSEGSSLSISPEILKEVAEGYKNGLPKGEQSEDFTEEERKALEPVDALEAEIKANMSKHGLDYQKASDLVFSSKPELFEAYHKQTFEFYEGRA